MQRVDITHLHAFDTSILQLQLLEGDTLAIDGIAREALDMQSRGMKYT